MSTDEVKKLLEKVYLKNTEVIGAYSNKPAICLGDVFTNDSLGDCFTDATSEDGITVGRYMYYQGKFSTITKFSDKIAVKTPTQEQFDFVRTWSGSNCSFSSSVWEKYTDDTVIVPSRGQYGMKEDDGLVYITFDEFLLVTNQTFEMSQSIQSSDIFILPKHWKVEITDENRTVLDKFKKSLGREDCRQYSFVCNEGFGWHEPTAHYIAITYEQFLQYVIKMSPDEYLGIVTKQQEPEPVKKNNK